MKIKFALVFLALLISSFLFSQGKVDSYRRMYRITKDLKEKAAKMEEINKIADASFKDFIIEVLDEQINYGNETNMSLKRDFENWIYYSSITAGKLRIEEAGMKIAALYNFVENPIYKGAMAYAAGMTKNKLVINWLNMVLNDLNQLHKMGQIKGKEEIVFGVLNGINELRDPSSFRYVFYACVPNYSSKIRELANKVLANISEDPSLYASQVIDFDDQMFLVYQMMAYVYNSTKTSDENKAATVVRAINRSLNTSSLYNQADLISIKQIRDEGVAMLAKLKPKTDEAIDVIRRKWDNDVLIKNLKDERVNAVLINIEALRSIGTEKARDELVNRLKFFNDKVDSGSGTGYGEKAGQLIVSAIIKALGDMPSNNDAIKELERVYNSGLYGEPLRKDAKASLEKLGVKK